MTLQQKMKSKIVTDFGSIQTLSHQLNNLSKHTSKKDRFYIDNMNIYFNSLFLTIVPVEEHAIKYRTQSLATIAFLKEKTKSHNCCTSQLLIDLIEFKLSEVSGINMLNTA